jgi:hypothetical protein
MREHSTEEPSVDVLKEPSKEPSKEFCEKPSQEPTLSFNGDDDRQ